MNTLILITLTLINNKKYLMWLSGLNPAVLWGQRVAVARPKPPQSEQEVQMVASNILLLTRSPSSFGTPWSEELVRASGKVGGGTAGFRSISHFLTNTYFV